MQNIPQVGSKEFTSTTIDIETSWETEPGKICNMIVVSYIMDNIHIPKGNYGKMEE